MRIFFRFCFVAVLGISTLTAAIAEDQERGYVGLELGYGWADVKAKETAQALANATGNTVTYSYDTAALTGRISAGYWVADQVALEVGYFSVADLQARYSGTYSGTSWSANETYNASGFDLAGVFKPSGSDFFLKAGVHSSSVDGYGSFSIAGLSVSTAATYSGTGWLVGGGYEWNMSDSSSVIGSYTYYDSLGGLSTGDLGFLSVGYRFKY
jgi:hypothetical protein